MLKGRQSRAVEGNDMGRTDEVFPTRVEELEQLLMRLSTDPALLQEAAARWQRASAKAGRRRISAGVFTGGIVLVVVAAALSGRNAVLVGGSVSVCLALALVFVRSRLQRRGSSDGANNAAAALPAYLRYLSSQLRTALTGPDGEIERSLERVRVLEAEAARLYAEADYVGVAPRLASSGLEECRVGNLETLDKLEAETRRIEERRRRINQSLDQLATVRTQIAVSARRSRYLADSRNLGDRLAGATHAEDVAEAYEALGGGPMHALGALHEEVAYLALVDDLQIGADAPLSEHLDGFDRVFESMSNPGQPQSEDA